MIAEIIFTEKVNQKKEIQQFFLEKEIYFL